MKKLRAVFCLLVSMCVFSLHAGIFFADPDINGEDNILFTVRNSNFNEPECNSLFSVNVNSGIDGNDQKPVSGVFPPHAELLTTFPENMELVLGNSILQIRNGYGTALYNLKNRSLEWMSKNWQRDYTVSFDVSHSPEISVSPDGKYHCYIEKKTHFNGKLVLQDIENKSEKIIAIDVPFSLDEVPVVWASDSSVLFYEKDGNIYFLSPSAYFRGVETTEHNRKIGAGKINSIFSTGRFIFYVSGDCVYRIGIKELYTLGLYSDVIGTGTLVGRLADVFMPEEDYFSISDDFNSMAVVRGGRNVAVYSLPHSGSNYLNINSYMPYINQNGSVVKSKIFWTKDNNPIFWVLLLPYDGTDVLSIINTISDKNIFPAVTYAGDLPPVFSPEKDLALVSSAKTLYVFDAAKWAVARVLDGEKIVKMSWLNKNEVIAGGVYTIKRWKLAENITDVILLSSVDTARWSDIVPCASANGKNYRYNFTSQIWEETNASLADVATVQNGKYRVYCAESRSPKYDNALFVRTLTGSPETNAVFAETYMKNYDSQFFAPAKKIALMFDVYDNAEGISKILYALKKHNVSATFFLNGEFIKRYPKETKQISKSGNECASMFFTMAGFSSPNFSVDEEFVRRGLARTEDLFYQVTGKELSLLWHAPNYIANKEIRAAARNAGYTYVEPYIIASNTEQLISSLNRNGGILQINMGVLGEKNNFIYKDMELLLNALLDEGFEIVKISDK